MWQVSLSHCVLVSRLRGFLSARRWLFGSNFCYSGRSFSEDRALHNGGKKGVVEKLWKDLFSNPSRWRDHRLDKVNPRFPDFKHRETQEGLWLDSKWIPSWVEEKLTTKPPGTSESGISSWNRESAPPNGGKKAQEEKLWRELFLDPSMWRDHRLDKANPRFPDFKNKTTQDGLWLNSKWIPAWVEAKLAAMPPGMLELSIFSRNQVLSRCVKSGQYEETIKEFEQMLQDGIHLDKFTFFPVLNACARLGILEDGRRIHKLVIQNGCEADICVGSSLVDMYAKCGSIVDARRVFNKMPTRDVVVWNAMLAGYVKCGEGQQALELYWQMQQQGLHPDHVTFVATLNACASIADLERGRDIHEQIIQRGYESDIYVGSSLVGMYAKCGSIEDARKVFNQMPTRDVVAWTAMLAGYVKCGEGQKVLELSEEMQWEGVDPDPVTFVVILNACASVVALERGRCVHGEIIRRGYKSDVLVGSSLIDMYAKCGSIEDAQRVFHQMPTRQLVSWNAMLAGYVKCGEGQQALDLYRQMQWDGVDPDPATLVRVLNACASVAALEGGRHIHEEIIRRGFESDVFVGNSLIDMYAKCGSMENARRVFKQMPRRDVVAWNTMLAGYVNCGEGQQALELYAQMQRDGMEPNSLTYVAVLNACAKAAELEGGRHVHEQMILRGYESNVLVGNSLIDMYAKCESMKDAERVFNQMARRDVVAWTAMLAGYLKSGEGQQALELYWQMQEEGVDPDPVTFIVVLNACASVAALEGGRHIHEEITRRGYDSDVFVGSSLIDMYAKCGSIEDARRVFNQMPHRNMVTWTSMLAGYGWHGCVKEALEHFSQMCEYIQVDDVTFVSLLSACSHGGLVDEGLDFFKSMSPVYNLSPTAEHYACVVDLLGRAGRLVEAEDLISSMPMEPVATVWISLLGACRVHGNVEMGERSAKQVVELNPDKTVGYVLLANIYAGAGKWDSSTSIKQKWFDRGIKKTPGRSWIEVNNKVHSFVLGDTKHPQIVEIHAELEKLSGHMKNVGYVPDTRDVLHYLDGVMAFHLCHHSAKLAIAFGLISTAPGTQLHIVKNLRLCGDCHTTTKFITKIVGRAIIVRDANRLHHFEDGVCLCRNYW